MVILIASIAIALDLSEFLPPEAGNINGPHAFNFNGHDFDYAIFFNVKDSASF